MGKSRIGLSSGIIAAVLALFQIASSIPVSKNDYCPVPTSSDEFGSQKVLDLAEIRGHKVRLQFFYPSEEASKRLLDSVESTTTPTTTWNPLQGTNNYTTTTEAAAPAAQSVEEGSSSAEAQLNLDFPSQDIHCQWTFRVGNESQFLSLTFEKLSAPYSDNCEQAFVALQKENGYESRWCGNRRQANARPMSLLVRSSAVVTVFRSGGAPLLPVTGFKVSVKQVDFGGLQSAQNSLRVLLG